MDAYIKIQNPFLNSEVVDFSFPVVNEEFVLHAFKFKLNMILICNFRYFIAHTLKESDPSAGHKNQIFISIDFEFLFYFFVTFFIFLLLYITLIHLYDRRKKLIFAFRSLLDRKLRNVKFFFRLIVYGHIVFTFLAFQIMTNNIKTMKVL